jgi:hypothetical protein
MVGPKRSFADRAKFWGLTCCYRLHVIDSEQSRFAAIGLSPIERFARSEAMSYLVKAVPQSKIG